MVDYGYFVDCFFIWPFAPFHHRPPHRAVVGKKGQGWLGLRAASGNANDITTNGMIATNQAPHNASLASTVQPLPLLRNLRVYAQTVMLFIWLQSVLGVLTLVGLFMLPVHSSRLHRLPVQGYRKVPLMLSAGLVLGGLGPHLVPTAPLLHPLV